MGHIQKRERSSGTVWRARYLGPDGREHRQTFRRKSEAEQFLIEVESQKHRGAWIDPARGRITLREWSKEWLTTKRRLKPKTREGYRSLLRSRILPELGASPLSKLRRVDVERWVSTMVEAGLSASRIRQAVNVLGAMLDAAIDNQLIARNVARRIELPRLPNSERRFITAEQVAAVANSVPDSYEALVYVLAYGGLRWGGAAALRRERCDLLRRRIRRGRVGSRDQRPVRLGDSEDPPAPGTVNLPAFVCEVLARHLATHVAADPQALVFTSPDGDVLRPDLHAANLAPFRRGGSHQGTPDSS